MATSSRSQFECCFQNWVAQQHKDLSELTEGLSSCPMNDENLKSLIEKGLKHFGDYADKRAKLAKVDCPLLLSPPWCTTLENSFLWIGGCRPSLSIRLVYSLCGTAIEAKLGEYLNGEKNGDLGEISGDQLNLINDLHIKTMKEEDNLTAQMATLKDDVADLPLMEIARRATHLGKMSNDVYKSMDDHSLALSTMLIDADKLRLSTTKELINILSPFQTVDLLVAAKKLHLSIHEWRKKRDASHKKV